MKLNIGTKYTGDYLTAEEFNQLVSAINNYKLGELTNVNSTVDEDVEDDCVLVKYAGEDTFTLKRLAEITTPVIGLQRYIALQNNMISKNVAVSKGDNCLLDFTFVSQERYSSADKYTNTDERGLLQVAIKNSTYSEYTIVKQVYINSAEPTKLDITEYLTSSSNSVMLKCEGEVTGETTSALVYTVTVTTLGINADNFRWWQPYSGDIAIPFIISGNITKKLFVTVTGNGYSTSYEENLGTTTYTETPYNYTVPRPTADGVYKITAYVSNLDETLVTKQVSFNVIVASTGSQKKYLVVNNVNTTIKNYSENNVLEYAVYDGDSSTTDLNFTIVLEGKQVYLSTEDAAPTQSRNSFTYQAEIEYESNSNFEVTLAIGDDVTKNLVTPISLVVDNSYSFGSTAGATFYMNPRTRSNAQSDRTKIVNEVTGEEIAATWTNFNWGNDVWQTDDAGNRVLRVMSNEKLVMDYYPFKTEAARKGKTIEIDYLVDNVIDYSQPVIQMCSSEDEYTGLRITPDNICLLSQSLKNKVTQATNTDTGKRIRLTVVIMPTAYGNADFNLAILYINGKKNREFSYATNDYFAQSSPVTIGSNFADVDVYGIRMYDMALTSQQVLKNYINWLTDNAEKEQVNTANDVLDITGTEVDFDNTIDQYNIMVFDNDLPSYLDPNEKKGTLSIYFYEHPERNVSISNVKASGQGTSSKKYFRWNTKYKLDKEKTVITYADGTTGTKKWQMTPDVPAASVFTAKKNFASSMQSHKMGSVNSVDLLYKELGLTNEAMELDSTKRIAVYQMPFIMFTKSVNEEGDTVYRFEGEYTFGADKGDENTFGYDTDKFPRLISIEGSDNSPLPALFRVPWSSRMQYNEDEEAFQYNGQNCWDFGGGEVENIDLWIPAYNLAYECSNRIRPFNGTLDELNADVVTYRSSGYDYWIAKEGDANQYNQYYYESSEGRFIGADTGNGTINLLTQLADYIDTASFSALSNEEKNSLFITSRIAKFRDEAPTYFDITDAIFHRNWIEVHAGTDQRAKNTYPYCFGDGYKWKWRFDDMDTIFDTDNQGQPLKKYSVEVQDEGVWNGQTSNFWNLIDLAYPEEIHNEMTAFLNAMETLGGLNVGDDYGKLYAYFKRFYLDSSQYFPAAVVNADTKYCYETAKLNTQYVNDTDPMTQALGDHYSAESAWISKRINYIMSKYSYGNFSAHGNDTIIVRAAGDLINYQLTPAIDLYPNIANGTSIVRGNRTYAGDTTVMTIDLGGSADQQNIIQGASWYSSIGDWHDKNVKGTMTIQGKRLQELVLGSKTDDITIKIDALEVKSTCKSLQSILLSNISTLKGNLDLSGCTHLREIYADGTALSQIILPKGSLEHIEYPDTSQYLNLQNYPLLTYDNVKLGNSIGNINDMIITACPQMQPVRMLSDIISEDNHSLKRIRLTDFDETFDSSNGSKVLDNLAILTNGNYTGLDANGIEIEGSYPFLDGTITVNCNCYEDSVEALRSKFNRLTINVNGQYYIRFKDQTTQDYIVGLWGDGKGVTKSALKPLTSSYYGTLFFAYVSNGTADGKPTDDRLLRPISMNYELGEYFDELKYFTGCERVTMHNTRLKGVIFPAQLNNASGPKIAVAGSTVEYVKYMDGEQNLTVSFDNNYSIQQTIELLYLPHNVVNMADYVFRSVSYGEFYIAATTPPVMKWGYGSSVNAVKGKVYIPVGAKATYEAATYWSNFVDKFEEYDYDEDGRGIIPYMEYTKELTGLRSSYKNGYIETVLTPRNAVRDLVYETNVDNFLKISQTGKLTFGHFGTSQVKIYNSYKPELYSTITLSVEKPANGYYSYNAPDKFDTGIPLTLNTKMYMKFNNFQKSIMMGLSGSAWNSSNGMYFNANSTSQLRFINNGTTLVNVTAGELLEVLFENGKVTVNGTEYTLGVRTESATGTIKLFNNNYAMDEPNFIGDMYEIKIYEGDELVGHYQPSTDGTLVELV